MDIRQGELREDGLVDWNSGDELLVCVLDFIICVLNNSNVFVMVMSYMDRRREIFLVGISSLQHFICGMW